MDSLQSVEKQPPLGDGLVMEAKTCGKTRTCELAPEFRVVRRQRGGPVEPVRDEGGDRTLRVGDMADPAVHLHLELRRQMDAERRGMVAGRGERVRKRNDAP